MHDHQPLETVLRANPASIILCNIEHGMSEQQWEHLIRQLMADQSIDCRLGVVSQHGDRRLAEKYLMEMGVPCGFISLRVSPRELLRTLLTVLEANEARGKRRYVRAPCTAADMATFNLKVYGRVFDGSVVDISSAGMAATFDQPIDLSVGKEMVDMQLKLRGSLCRVRVTHLGGKDGDEGRLHVFSFDHSANPECRPKVQEFVYGTLQREMDRQLASARGPGAPGAGTSEPAGQGIAAGPSSAAAAVRAGAAGSAGD